MIIFRREDKNLALQASTRADEQAGGNGGVEPDVVPKLVKALPPSVRRVLKGHFGKVYAMRWGGALASGASCPIRTHVRPLFRTPGAHVRRGGLRARGGRGDRGVRLFMGGARCLTKGAWAWT